MAPSSQHLEPPGIPERFKVYKAAVISVLKEPEHPLTQHYERLLEAGTKPPNAKLTIARKIAALSLAMWRNQEAYDPARYTPHS